MSPAGYASAYSGHFFSIRVRDESFYSRFTANQMSNPLTTHSPRNLQVLAKLTPIKRQSNVNQRQTYMQNEQHTHTISSLNENPVPSIKLLCCFLI